MQARTCTRAVAIGVAHINSLILGINSIELVSPYIFGVLGQVINWLGIVKLVFGNVVSHNVIKMITRTAV